MWFYLASVAFLFSPFLANTEAKWRLEGFFYFFIAPQRHLQENTENTVRDWQVIGYCYQSGLILQAKHKFNNSPKTLSKKSKGLFWDRPFNWTQLSCSHNKINILVFGGQTIAYTVKNFFEGFAETYLTVTSVTISTLTSSFLYRSELWYNNKKAKKQKSRILYLRVST